MNPSQLPLPLQTSILGIGVSRTTYDETVQLVLRAAQERRPLIVSALAVHGLMTGVLDRRFGDILNRFDILTPDGQPVRWALNWFGAPRLQERVYGPTLMLRVCAVAEREQVGVYLFGSRPEVLAALSRRLHDLYPKLSIVGMHADRFREASPDEDAADVADIQASGAGIVFCARGCPLQERWCHDHRDRLNRPLLAVGAAFDFHAGLLPQAPAWMQAHGLEWLFRLWQEPRRLYRRYLFLNPLYLLCLLLQATGCAFRRPAPVPSERMGATGGGGLPPPRYKVLGVGISATNIPACLESITAAIRDARKGYVCVTSVHGVMESQQNARLRAIHNDSFLTVPDGAPLAWAGRRNGFAEVRRVYGPDLMAAVCQASVEPGWSHFLYGGKEGVAAELKKKLEERFPGIRIVGTYCPPFRPLNAEEQIKLIGAVKAAHPDILWVGLSTPKQEFFMAEYLPQLDATLMCGVGAAFDIHTGRLKDAPPWIKRAGLQWLHRLFQEPRRLWRRYLYIVPAFILRTTLERLGFPQKRDGDTT